VGTPCQRERAGERAGARQAALLGRVAGPGTRAGAGARTRAVWAGPREAARVRFRFCFSFSNK
jgi:hypothetical protein